MHICETDGTILLESIIFALVVVFHGHHVAAATPIAVELAITAPNSTNAALIAVIDILARIVVVETTNFTVISSEVDFALGARF